MSSYETFEEAVAARRRGFGNLSEASAALIVRRNLRECNGAFVWRTDPRLRWPSLVRLSEAQVRACLGAIKSPALLIAGEQGILAERPEARERLNCIAGLTMVWLPGGHHLHMEPEPDRVARQFMEFLARQPSERRSAESDCE